MSRISAGGKLSLAEETAVLAELEANECWQPLMRHLDGQIARGGAGLDRYYILAIRIRLQYFKDTTAAQALASDLIRRCGLSFKLFRERLLNDELIQAAGPDVEAALIEAAVGAFDQVGEKVAALERLAAVFEKRLFHDQNLFLVFERLTQLDPDNLKALRYFKMVFSQNNEWQQVARILRRMIEVVSGRHEKYRLAHDLAYALVYHLNQPRDALVILDRYCRESPLDVSQVEYDASFRTGDLKRCIHVLQTAQKGVRDDAGRAVIHLRMAELHRRTGDLAAMERCLEESLEAWPVFLDPFEPLIQLHLSTGRWGKVIQLLDNLALRVQDKELVAQIRETVRRVESGLQDRSEGRKKTVERR